MKILKHVIIMAKVMIVTLHDLKIVLTMVLFIRDTQLDMLVTHRNFELQGLFQSRPTDTRREVLDGGPGCWPAPPKRPRADY
jgi:hypothetical protein